MTLEEFIRTCRLPEVHEGFAPPAVVHGDGASSGVDLLLSVTERFRRSGDSASRARGGWAEELLRATRIRFPRGRARSDDRAATTLVALALESRPTSILGVGDASGGHALELTRALGAEGVVCRVVCIDTFFGGAEMFAQAPSQPDFPTSGRLRTLERFLERVHTAGASDSVFPMPSTFPDAADALRRKDVAVDLVYVDGASADDVAERLATFWPFVRPRGALAAIAHTREAEDAARRFAAEAGVVAQARGECLILRRPPDGGLTLDEFIVECRLPEIQRGFEPLAEIDLQGWTGQDGPDPIFEDLIDEVRPTSIIEVGTWKGASAVHMAQLTRARGLDCKIVCIDTWLGGIGMYVEEAFQDELLPAGGRLPMLEQFLTNVHRLEMTESIFAMPSTSREAARALRALGVRVDLVYIDGEHEYSYVRRDLDDYWPLVRPGGVLFGDDYSPDRWPGVVQAADEFAAQIGLDYEVSCGDYVFRKPV